MLFAKGLKLHVQAKNEHLVPIIHKLGRSIDDPTAADILDNAPESLESCLKSDFPSSYCAGPIIKYVEISGKHWIGSILIVSQIPDPPRLSCTAENHKELCFGAQALDHSSPFLKDVFFWRFNVRVPQFECSTKYQYNINEEAEVFCFHVPGFTQDYYNWMFYTCNGFPPEVSDEEIEAVGGISPMWNDFYKRHIDTPYHAMIAGGDQVYADQFWYDCPSIVEWLNTKGKENRYEYPWSDAMEREVSQFFFDLYLKQWGEPSIQRVFASVPSINVLDDHDFWNFALARSDNYFGKDDKAYNFVRQLGPRTAVMCVDARSERSLDRIVSPESWDMIKGRLYGFPDSIKHLIFVTGVPVIHRMLPSLILKARLDFAEVILNSFGEMKESTNKAANAVKEAMPFLKDTVDSMKHSFGKVGIFSTVINQFGLPELADDLADHWTANNHMVERQFMVEMLQDLSQRKQIRVTLIAGDVHCCAMGMFYNKEQGPDCQDFRLMYQITSSAISNIPPPPAVVGLFNNSAATEYDLNEHTHELQLRPFVTDVDGNYTNGEIGVSCLGRRNYCTCLPSQADDLLSFVLHVESNVIGADSVAYTQVVPALLIK